MFKDIFVGVRAGSELLQFLRGGERGFLGEFGLLELLGVGVLGGGVLHQLGVRLLQTRLAVVVLQRGGAGESWGLHRLAQRLGGLIHLGLSLCRVRSRGG